MPLLLQTKNKMEQYPAVYVESGPVCNGPASGCSLTARLLLKVYMNSNPQVMKTSCLHAPRHSLRLLSCGYITLCYDHHAAADSQRC